MRGPTLGALVLVVLATAAAVVSRSGSPAELDAATRRSLTRIRAYEYAGVRDIAPNGGVSMYRPVVVELEAGRADRLESVDGFHSYVHRCTSCHATPDPAMHAPEDWLPVVERMSAWMSSAGLLPMESSERARIELFLSKAGGVAE